jgi:hypothetical protein
MDSLSSSNLTFPESGSRLLSESSPGFYPNTGPGGDDISISELSLSRPFSLTRPEPSRPAHEDDGDSFYQDDIDAGDIDDVRQDDPDPEKAKRLAGTLREEKLQSDAFILKKLNASFALFNEALAKTGSANEVRAFSILLWPAQLELTAYFVLLTSVLLCDWSKPTLC